jgi:hypothetical protein
MKLFQPKSLASIILKTGLLAVVLLAISPAQPAYANACTWTGSTSTDWNDASNWSGCGGVIPQAADTVVIQDVTNDPVLGSDVTVAGLTINTGGVLSLGSRTLTLTDGGITNSGTLTGGTGTLILAFTAQRTLSGSGLYDLNHLTVNASGGTVNLSSGVTLHVGGNFAKQSGSFRCNSVLDAASNSCTLDFDGGGSSTLSWATSSILPWNITVQAGTTVNIGASNNTFTLRGSLEGSGTLTASAGTITFDTVTTVNLAGNKTLNNVVLNTANGMTLGSDLTINGTLTLTSGKVVTGANSLILGSGGSISGAGAGKYVSGNLRVPFAAGSPAAYTFPVGDSASYIPIILDFGTVSTAGSVTASTQNSVCGNFSSSNIDPNNYINRCWTLTNGGVVFDTYDVTLTYDSTLDFHGSIDESLLDIQKYSASWSNPPGSSTAYPALDQVKAVGYTAFSDFAMGNVVILPQYGSGCTWPSEDAWITVTGFTDPDDGTSYDQLDFVGDTTDQGLFTAGTSSYLYLRARVDIGAVTSATFRDTVMVIVDNDQDGIADYGFAWDSKSNDNNSHGLEMTLTDVSGATWDALKMDDVDGSVGQKYSPPDFNQTGDGCLRTLDSQATTNFGTTSFIDFAISWSYLEGSSTTTLARGQNWDIQLGSIANATDHNYITYDVSGNQAPSSTAVFPGTLQIAADGTTTPVTLSYFRAERGGVVVTFNWSTMTESGNVGFNLYAGKDGEWLQLNDELLASHTTDSLDRQDYTFRTETDAEVFYIEDVSVLGETRRHGPFEIGETYGGRLDADKVDWQAVAAARPSLSTTPGGDSRLFLKVDQTGLYRVGYESLRAAGYDLAGVPLEQIGLNSWGQAVPVHVTGRGGVFGPGSVIEFYGEALDSLYTGTNIYTLQVGQPGKRVAVERKAASKQIKTPLAYRETLTVERQRAYANYAPGADAWYDTSMLAYTTPKSWDFNFDVDGLADPNGSVRLDLLVWGVTDWPQAPDHHLRVSLNGMTLGEAAFDGLVEQTLSLSLPAGTLREGSNTLTLTLPGDTGVKWDMVNLDRFSLTYQRVFAARDGRLTFSAKAKAFKVTDLPGKDVIVYRLGENGAVRLAKVAVAAENGSYSATFAGSGQMDTYLVTAAGQTLAPGLENVPIPGADLKVLAKFVIIAHPDFIPGLAPLVQARQSEGMSVKVVDVTDLYARYTYGVFDPQAIRDYIAYAHTSLGTEYVLLVGGDTYDYHDYLGRGSLSFIPSLYATTGEIAKFVPADPLYADVDGDQIPDLALGRFPVRTAAELGLIVQKTLDYGSKDYRQTAVFVSDKHDGVVSFKTISGRMAAKLPADWTVENLHLDDLGTTAAQTRLLEAMNRGTALVTFTGHSGPAAWTFGGLFNTQHASGLTNAGRPFVTVQWGCWNTYYVDPVNNYLVQSLLFAGDRGTAAVLGASTLTDSNSEALLGELLTPKLVTPGTSLGQALRDAKRQLAASHPNLLDVLLGWSLMGDPTLTVEP